MQLYLQDRRSRRSLDDATYISSEQRHQQDGTATKRSDEESSDWRSCWNKGATGGGERFAAQIQPQEGRAAAGGGTCSPSPTEDRTPTINTLVGQQDRWTSDDGWTTRLQDEDTSDVTSGWHGVRLDRPKQDDDINRGRLRQSGAIQSSDVARPGSSKRLATTDESLLYS